MDRRYIALQGAVGLDGDEASLGAEALSLRFDDLDVVGVDLRDHHRHVRREAMRRVVGNDRALRLGVFFLERLDLVLLHIDSAEAEVDLCGYLFHILRIHDDHVLVLFGKLRGHVPSAVDALAVGLACRTAACRQRGDLKPGVVLQQERKALTYHTGCSDDSYLVLFHFLFLHIPTKLKKAVA